MTIGFELTDVHAGYNGKTVLNGITLDLGPGELLALIGPNGAGKTTMSRIFSRSIRPTSGRVTLEGRPLEGFRPQEYARLVAHVGQSERIAWRFSVSDVVRMGRLAHRGWFAPYTPDDRVAINEAIRTAGLLDLRDRPIDTLSGGEVQRALLARAIAQQPRYFILDEPVAHLDIKYQIDVLETARSLADSGHGVAMCLHDLSLTGLYADRVALVDNGSIRALGTPAEVLQKETIESVYGSPVHIDTYPGSDRVYVTPLPSSAAGRVQMGGEQ